MYGAMWSGTMDSGYSGHSLTGVRSNADLNCRSNPDPYLRAQQHLAFGAGESKQLIMIAGGELRDARIGRITVPND